MGTTDAQGKFGFSQTIYSPIIKLPANIPTPNPTEAHQLLRLRGTYEITVSADGYETYTKQNATDEDIFHHMTVMLNKLP